MTNKAFDFSGLVESEHPDSISLFQAVDRGAPDYVKQASYQAQARQEDLPDHDFGLILEEEQVDALGRKKMAEHRLFPMTDASSTWLQIEALRRTGDSMPEEARKVAAYHITNAAERHGLQVPIAISNDAATMEPCSNRLSTRDLVDPSIKVAAEARQAAVPDSDECYALVKEGERRYPIHTKNLIKKASEYFDRYEHDFSPSDRWQFANKVAAKAASLGLTPTAKIASYAGYHWDQAGSQAALKERAYHVKTAAEGEALSALEGIVGKVEPHVFAELLDKFDAGTHMAARSSDLPDPYAATMKTAADVSAVVDASNVRGSLDQLDDRGIASIIIRHQDKLSSYLGTGLVRQLGDHPKATVEALDDDQREVLHQIISGAI